MKLLFVFATIICISFDKEDYVSYVVDLKQDSVRFFHKDATGSLYGTFEKLNNELTGKQEELVFAMNGGMFLEGYDPCGLYVENGKVIRRLNQRHSKTGVFYITRENKAAVCSYKDYNGSGVRWATQSLPVLLQKGVVNPEFRKQSSSVYIRNGVGILPDGRLLFLITTKEVSLRAFASMFKNNGCTDALYLDGNISEMYCPAKGLTESMGTFGVLIAVVK